MASRPAAGGLDSPGPDLPYRGRVLACEDDEVDANDVGESVGVGESVDVGEEEIGPDQEGDATGPDQEGDETDPGEEVVVREGDADEDGAGQEIHEGDADEGGHATPEGTSPVDKGVRDRPCIRSSGPGCCRPAMPERCWSLPCF